MPEDTLPLHVQVRREQKQAKLEHLGYTDYDEYLNAPHWRNVRRRYRESDRTQLCICGADGVLLHHKTYERLGAEELSDLIPLCEACHEMVHALLRRGEFVNYSDFASLERANQYFDQHKAQIRRAQAEAPPSLEERVYAKAKARSKARRRRSGQPKRQRSQPKVTDPWRAPPPKPKPRKEPDPERLKLLGDLWEAERTARTDSSEVA